MADTMTAAAATPTKGTKAKSAKPKKPKSATNHPKYVEMTVAAINALKERNGSSRQAILKYIMSHYSVGKDPKVVNTHLKMALKRGVASGVLKHAKGQGASGSFRVTGEKKPVVKRAAITAKPAKKPATAEKKVKKVKAEKVKKPKVKTEKKKVSAAVKPKKEKKVKSPKKSVEKKKSVKAKKPKSPKKSSSEKKKAAKPKKIKKAKSPKKGKK